MPVISISPAATATENDVSEKANRLSSPDLSMGNDFNLESWKDCGHYLRTQYKWSFS